MLATRDALECDGAVVLRDFLSADEIEKCRALVKGVYDRLAAVGARGHPGLEHNFRTWNGVWLAEVGSYLSAESAALSKSYAELTETITRKLRRIAGSAWRYYPNRSYFRHYTGREELVPWHIDADAAGIGRDECINIWMPLQTVGNGLPSLEVVYGSHVAMRKLPSLTGERRYRDDSFVASIGQPTVIKLDPGDVLIFDQHTLHRTQPHNGAFERTSCEFRFIVPTGWRRVLSVISPTWPPPALAGMTKVAAPSA